MVYAKNPCLPLVFWFKHIRGGQRKAFLIKKFTVAQRHIELSIT
jgi:hypothetical protein